MVTEPTPPRGDDVPDSVLDELKRAFASPAPVVPAVPVEPVASGDTQRDRASTVTIVIGHDDDLADAVYLDDAHDLGPPVTRTGTRADDPRGRTTIVIGDDLDSSGAYDAVEVPSRSMDPRVRARRIAVKRAAGRRRLLWFGAVAGVVVLVVGVLGLFSSSLFAVEVVDVQGGSYSEARYGDRLDQIIEEMTGKPVLLVDTLRAERDLEQIPWIERAFVDTDFPHRVLIDIRERQPLATFTGSDGRYRVIDRDGRVLDVLDGRPADYMLLTGPGPDLEAGGLAAGPFAEAAKLVGALPAELRAITLSGSVDATTGDLGLVMQGAVGRPDIEVRLGNPTGLDSKLARLLQQVRDGLDGIVRLDVSTDEVIRSPL